MVVLTTEEHVARELIGNGLDKFHNMADASRYAIEKSLDKVENEIVSLSENPNIGFSAYMKTKRNLDESLGR